MADRPDATELEFQVSPLIERRKAAWLNRKGDVFCYTRIDPWPGSSEAREQPPAGAFGVIVHPEDHEEVLEMIARGDLRY